MFERFAVGARAAVTASADEARRRGDRRIGTDHLLLGLLHDPGSAEALGVTVEAAREKSDALDRAALAAIGLDLGRLLAVTEGQDRHQDAVHLRVQIRHGAHPEADDGGKGQADRTEAPAARPP